MAAATVTDGGGLAVGTGRVRMTRKVPAAGIALVLAAISFLVAALSASLVYWGAEYLPDEVIEGASTAGVAALVVGIAALCVAALERAVPHETWGLLLTAEGRAQWLNARRFRHWYARKHGELFDAVLADNGRHYRPGIGTFVIDADGALVVRFKMPRVMRGTDPAVYHARAESYGPRVTGFHQFAVRDLEPGFWATILPVQLVRRDGAEGVRRVGEN